VISTAWGDFCTLQQIDTDTLTFIECKVWPSSIDLINQKESACMKEITIKKKIVFVLLIFLCIILFFNFKNPSNKSGYRYATKMMEEIFKDQASFIKNESITVDFPPYKDDFVMHQESTTNQERYRVQSFAIFENNLTVDYVIDVEYNKASGEWTYSGMDFDLHSFRAVVQSNPSNDYTPSTVVSIQTEESTDIENFGTTEEEVVTVDIPVYDFSHFYYDPLIEGGISFFNRKEAVKSFFDLDIPRA
jgi:hypothetical protein